MELARIILNPADRHARQDLADPYELHSSLARAFATPYGAAPARWLWRQEPLRDGELPQVLVQSPQAGDWQALQAAKPGWAQRIDTRAWHPGQVLRAGLGLRFRLRANPCITQQGKRRALLQRDEQLAWLARQLGRHGYVPLQADVVESGKLMGQRRKGGGAQVTVHAVLFEGDVRVADPAAAEQAIASGLGHAKMMGLGLMSVAPTAT